MLEGKTKSGFEFAVDERRVNDQTFLDLLIDGESDDASVKLKATRDLYVFLLGKEGYENLKEHVRQMNDGYCPSDIVSAEFLEIMSSAKDLKN